MLYVGVLVLIFTVNAQLSRSVQAEEPPPPDTVPCGEFRLMHYRSFYNYSIEEFVVAIAEQELLKALASREPQEVLDIFDANIARLRAEIDRIALEQLDRFPLMGVLNTWVKLMLSGSAAPDNGTDTMVQLGTRHAQFMAMTCL